MLTVKCKICGAMGEKKDDDHTWACPNGHLNVYMIKTAALRRRITGVH